MSRNPPKVPKGLVNSLSRKRLESLPKGAHELEHLGYAYTAKSVREAYRWIKKLENKLNKDSQHFEIEARKVELELMIRDAKFLAMILCSVWYEATVTDEERQQASDILVKLGYEGGLSEDTYYEMTSPRCETCGKMDAWLVVMPRDTDERHHYCNKTCYMGSKE